MSRKRPRSPPCCTTLVEAILDQDHYTCAHALIHTLGSVVDTEDHPSGEQQTLLHLAVYRYNTDIVTLLLQHGANPNARNAAGETPLHRACQVLDDIDPRDVVVALIEHGALLHVKDHRGHIPFHFACSRSHAATVALLLAVDPTQRYVRDPKGKTALSFCGDPRAVQTSDDLYQQGTDYSVNAPWTTTDTVCLSLLLRQGPSPAPQDGEFFRVWTLSAREGRCDRLECMSHYALSQSLHDVVNVAERKQPELRQWSAQHTLPFALESMTRALVESSRSKAQDLAHRVALWWMRHDLCPDTTKLVGSFLA